MDDALCSIGRAQQPPLAFFLIGRGGLLPRAWRSCRVLLSNRAGSTRILRGRTLGARVRSEAARAPFLNAGERKTSSLPLCDRSSLSLSLSLTSEPRRSSSLPKKKKKKNSSRPTRPPSSRRSSRTSRSRTGRFRSGSASAPGTRSDTTPSAATGGAPSSGSRERERDRKREGRTERERGRVFFLCSLYLSPPSVFLPLFLFSAHAFFDKCVTLDPTPH